METIAMTAPTSLLSACWFGAAPLRWAVLPLAVLSGSVFAQVVPPTPGAGQLLKQVEPVIAPPSPTVEKPALRIEPAAVAAPTAEASTPIAVTTIELSGNKSIDTATLKALVANAEGRTQTLAELNALAQRVTEYYRAQGQPLASAYLPAQTMDGGVLRIVIVEAIYGQIRVENRSRMSTAQIESFVASLKPGEVVRQEPLDRSLLLLRDLAGVTVTADARPGAEAGTTDLVVSAIDAGRVGGSFSLDNQGSKSTGRARGLVSADLRNMLGRGETFSLLGLTSGEGMAYARLSAQAPVTGVGTTVGLGVAELQYKLGGAFASLEANGTATVVDGFVQQAVVRSARAALNADLRMEHKVLRDRADKAGTKTDRTLVIVTPGLSGELRDELGGGGRTNFSISYSAGKVGFDDAIAEAKDQDPSTGLDTLGTYGRLNMELARQQSLGAWPALANTTLFARVRGQVASKNLDSSEQISIAGPQGVRGYDSNALSGAQGYVATLEVRQALGSTPYGAFQAQAFVDSGRVTVNKNPLVNSPPNSASMHSAGLGVNWGLPSGWNAQLSVARPIGPPPAIAAHRSTRAWLTVGGSF